MKPAPPLTRTYTSCSGSFDRALEPVFEADLRFFHADAPGVSARHCLASADRPASAPIVAPPSGRPGGCPGGPLVRCVAAAEAKPANVGRSEVGCVSPGRKKVPGRSHLPKCLEPALTFAVPIASGLLEELDPVIFCAPERGVVAADLS